MNYLFPVSGEKTATLVLSDDAFLFSSKSFSSIDDFFASWDKSLTLATTLKIRFADVKSIVKEEGDDDISIKYKQVAGLPGDQSFGFTHESDRDKFYELLQKEKGFQRSDDTLSPIKAASSNLVGLAITLAITVYAYIQAVAIDTGEFVESTGHSRSARRGRFLYMILEKLGTSGVLVVGLLIAAYFGYMSWKKYKNPHSVTTLIPA